MKFVKDLLLYSISLGLAMALGYFLTSQNPIEAVIAGVAGGLIGGTLLTIFMHTQSNRMNRAKDGLIKKIGDDDISFSGPASIGGNFMPKIGWLALTKTHLIFALSAKKDRNPEILEIELSKISNITPVRFRLNSNALLVTYDGKKQVFLMDGVKSKDRIRNVVWIEKIKEAKNNYELTKQV